MNATDKCTDKHLNRMAHTRIFFSLRTLPRQMWWHVWLKSLTICLRASKIISSLVMSLLNVPSIVFPPIFSSPAASLTPPTAWPTPLTGIRLNPCATPLWRGPSGHLVDPIPTHRLWAQVLYRCQWRAHADQPSDQKRSPLPRTLIYLDTPEHQAAASTRQQADFPLCWNTILFHVGQAPRRLVRTWIVKPLFQVFSCLCQRGREIETKTLCKHWETGKISKKILEREAELIARGEKLAQQRFFEAETEVEVKHWEKRNSDIALYEINRRNMGWSGSKRQKKLVRRIGNEKQTFPRNQAKYCQEIEELRRKCCEETDTEQDKKELMNSQCIKRGILLL